MALLLLLVVHTLLLVVIVSSSSDQEWSPVVPVHPNTDQVNLSPVRIQDVQQNPIVQDNLEDYLSNIDVDDSNIEEKRPSYFQSKYSPKDRYWNAPSVVPIKPDNIAEKTWNVPAPYFPPADNFVDDVSSNIGIILVVFIVFVLSLGTLAGALTLKQNGGRSLIENEGLTRLVYRSIDVLNEFNKEGE